MAEALKDVVRHIKNGFKEVVELSEFDQESSTMVRAKIKIRDFQSGEKWEDVPCSRTKYLKITKQGISLQGEEAKNYESIEALLQSETPRIWAGFLESRIAEKLEAQAINKRSDG